MLPVPPNSAGTGGAPVEAMAMRKVVSVLTAPAGKITEAPLDSVIVPPPVPMSGGDGGDGIAGGGAGAAGGGESLPPPPLPPHATNANKQAATISPARVIALVIIRASRPAHSPVRGSDA